MVRRSQRRRDRLLLHGVRCRREPADLLRRPGRAGRRPSQELLRPGAAGRGCRTAVPHRLLPPARHHRRPTARELSGQRLLQHAAHAVYFCRRRTGDRHRGAGCGTGARVHMAGTRRSGDAVSAGHRYRGQRPVDAGRHRSALRVRSAHAPSSGAAPGNRRYSGAARAGGPGRGDPHERGALGVPGPGASPCADARARDELLRGPAGGVEHHRVHHPHAGPGRQRELRRPPGARSGGCAAFGARAGRARIPGAGPYRARRRWARTVRSHTARAASGGPLQRRQQAARSGFAPHVARSVAGRAGGRGADLPHHQWRASAELDLS